MAVATLRPRPVPAVRSVTEWRTRDGKKRRVRLYSAWVNMKGRLSGRIRAGDGSSPWTGLHCGFTDWPSFRAWSLANGYSKTNNSLDRYPFPSDGYGPDRCRWITVAENTAFMNVCRRLNAPPASSSELPF